MGKSKPRALVSWAGKSKMSFFRKSRYPILSSPHVTKQASGGRRRGLAGRCWDSVVAAMAHGTTDHPRARALCQASLCLHPSRPAFRSADAGGLELEEPDCRLSAVEDDAPTRSREAALPLRSSPVSSSSLVCDLC
jgi:hypothetical protein